MAVSSKSRYAQSPISNVLGRTGLPTQAILHVESASRTFAFTYYQWTDTDRVDTLADAYYGDATRWWLIARANPEILDWQNVAVGATVRIPNG